MTYLDARERDIADLTCLEHYTDLSVLDLALNQITDITPLGNLTSLAELTIVQCYLLDSRIYPIEPS